jgi:hypothetical protein
MSMRHEKRQLSASSSTVAEAYKGMGRVIDPSLVIMMIQIAKQSKSLFCR